MSNDFDELSWDDDEDTGTVPCPFCGEEIYEDAEVCPECGNYVFLEPARTRRPRWIVWTAIVLIVAFLVFMLRLC